MMVKSTAEKVDSFESKLRGWMAVTLVALGTIATISLFVFKTNAAADVEHERLHGKILLESTHSERLDTAQKTILKKLEILQANQIKIGERLRIDDLVREGD